MLAMVQHSYGDTGVLAPAEIDRPSPGAREVLIRVRAAGVDPGVWHLMAGKPYLVRLFTGIRRPRAAVRGRDVAGTVVEVGSAVRGVTVGDEVFGASAGSFAEYAVARESRLARRPATLSVEDAAVLPVSGGAALKAVRDLAAVGAGQRVLVVGASGGVGAFAVQLAAHFGAEVTAVCSGRNAEFVRSLGATEVIDYTTDALDSRGVGYDAVIDIAGLRSVRMLRGLMSARGTLVLVGGEGGGAVGGPVGRTLAASALSPFVRQQLVGLVSTENTHDLETLADLFATGALRSVITRRFGLDDAAIAIDELRAGRVVGKGVVLVG